MCCFLCGCLSHSEPLFKVSHTHAAAYISTLYAGTPSPVRLAVSVLNATTLQVSWDPPFTFPGHEILHYNITVVIKTTGETIIDRQRVLGAEERVVSVSSPDGEIARKCNEITFTVTATNDLGEGDPTSVSGWLPIGICCACNNCSGNSSFE